MIKYYNVSTQNKNIYSHTFLTKSSQFISKSLPVKMRIANLLCLFLLIVSPHFNNGAPVGMGVIVPIATTGVVYIGGKVINQIFKKTIDKGIDVIINWVVPKKVPVQRYYK